MSDYKIQIEEKGTEGRAFVKGDRHEILAEMTFTKAGNGNMIINHTEVNNRLRGEGIGRIMLDALVKKSREDSTKILPLCPYVKSVFNKDDSISDVLV